MRPPKRFVETFYPRFGDPLNQGDININQYYRHPNTPVPMNSTVSVWPESEQETETRHTKSNNVYPALITLTKTLYIPKKTNEERKSTKKWEICDFHKENVETMEINKPLSVMFTLEIMDSNNEGT